jgi:putative PIN family toxin of toxin-antitoxin system
MDRVVIDTNVFVSALMNTNGAPREVLRLALTRQIRPLFGNALFAEYEDVLARAELFASAPLGEVERSELFDALLSVSEWTPIYFLWRPHLPDEGDNHLVELAVAGGAHAVISANVRDVAHGELVFPGLKVLSAGDYLNRRRTR